jgi:hypothetical protein
VIVIILMTICLLCMYSLEIVMFGASCLYLLLYLYILFKMSKDLDEFVSELVGFFYVVKL